jgi:uncharacterized repeat protein (TIGR01451 family)
MKTQCVWILKLIGSLFALALLGAPSLGTAGVLTIKSVRVVIGGVGAIPDQPFCDTTDSCSNIVWDLGGGVMLNDGETFILTQTDNPSKRQGGEEFDTSDRGPLLAGCSRLLSQNTPCTVRVYVDTGSGLQLVSSDDGNSNPLTAMNLEPTTNENTDAAKAFNEAEDWVTAQAPNFNFTGINFTLEFAYADNIHSMPCTAAGGCFPQHNWCTSPNGLATTACPDAATVFLGKGVLANNPQLGVCGINSGHPAADQAGTNVDCYDAGALRFTAHPPSLNVDKTPDGGTFTPGSQVSFTIVVSNPTINGSVAHNVQLTDALPGLGGLVWQTATTTQGTCTNPIVGNNLSCSLGNIASGGSVTVTVTSTATTPPEACQPQLNPIARATDAEGDNATDHGSLTCTQNPQVMIRKFTNNKDANDPNGTDVPNIPVGGTVTWRYEVTNTGNVPVAMANVVVTDDHAGVSPQPVLVGGFVQGDANSNNFLDPGETWIYQATGIALNLATTPLDPGKIVAGVCTHGNTQPPRNGYVNQGKVTIPGPISATDPSAYCNPPPSGGKPITIGPSSMEGAIKISNGDWVNGGFSLKTNFTAPISVTGTVTLTGPCSNGGTDTVTVPIQAAINAVAGSDWLPTGDANSVLSWQGAVKVGTTVPAICGGVGKLDASKGAVYNATVSGVPAGGHVTFRFKYRDPFAKGKPNTNCLDTTDPNRAKADVCGASWSETKTDP